MGLFSGALGNNDADGRGTPPPSCRVLCPVLLRSIVFWAIVLRARLLWTRLFRARLFRPCLFRTGLLRPILLPAHVLRTVLRCQLLWRLCRSGQLEPDRLRLRSRLCSANGLAGSDGTELRV